MVVQLEHMKKSILICSFWLFILMIFSSLMTAQTGQKDTATTAFILEEIELFSDKQLYISGETMWFSLSIRDRRSGSLSSLSKVAYVDLIGTGGLVMTRVKIEVNNGKGHGALDLSKDLASGNYQLRSYTQALRNFGPATFEEQTIIVLNPDQPIVTALSEQRAMSSHEATVSSDGVASISMNKQAYGQRDRVQLNIQLKDKVGRPISGEMALSVSLKGAGEHKKRSPSKTSKLESNPTAEYLPEDIGMYLSGHIVSEEGDQSIEGVKVFLAFPGERSMVYSALTDVDGMFRFVLPKLYGPKEIVIQVEPKYEDQLSIILDDEYYKSPTTEDPAFKLPEAWLDMANASLENASIRSAYGAFEEQVRYIEDSTFYSVPFYGVYDKQYILDDYTRFPLPEFYFEVVPEVRVQGKYGEEILKVANTWSLPNRESPPLFLVDGVPVFDQGKFLKINNKLIESTQIIIDPFWLNTTIYDGIIEISSFEKDARSFDLPESALRSGYLTLLPDRVFSTPNYGVNEGSNLPDFRNTLYWNPTITTDANGNATLEFYTSDVIGDYEIRVQGKDMPVDTKNIYNLSVTKSAN